MIGDDSSVAGAPAMPMTSGRRSVDCASVLRRHARASSRRRKQLHSGFGEKDTATVAEEELTTEVLLEEPDLAAESRLADAELRRRLVDACELGNGTKIAKGSKIHLVGAAVHEDDG